MDPEAVKKIYNQMVLERAGGDYEYQRWFSDKIKQAGYFMTKKSIEEQLLDEKFSSYLEVGPGAGTWTKIFMGKNLSANFDLVDISSAMLDLAKSALSGYKNIRFFGADFCDFNPDKKYDYFFSCRALEYFSDRERFVEKVFDLMTQGGRGMIITKSPKYLRNKFLGRQIQKLHQGQIGARRLKCLLKNVGFSEIKIYPVTFSFPFFRSSKINLFLFRIFCQKPLNFLSAFFAESYLAVFKK
ncbi:MAG: hypothetical protein A2174_02385 [Candidatus Portnoybacteria bacterium RBG_13_41_18]|uniref:Methyltransferase domain-containing protein n=1 Tax=Candidatus Portnoybacteria bacterium RBG_13_41_18 TaxID=1801991 RepID=A0A1G2FAZ9_9BACT|nr:MAG: hypothetical protein A2174_02385 [Candidatus Portnoybacteria bacterium RBG_13_41_18]